MQTGPVNKGLTNKHIILILSGLTIVCVTVVAVILLLRKPEEPVFALPPSASGNYIIDESNLSSIGSEVAEKVAKGMFETHMNTTWNFPDGKSPSNDAVMGNAASNNYPFWFTITIRETGELVYTSALLPVGSQLSEIVLDTELAKGTYYALMAIHMVDENGEELESDVGFNITLGING